MPYWLLCLVVWLGFNAFLFGMRWWFTRDTARRGHVGRVTNQRL